MSTNLKLYPKMGKDEGWLKFFFNHQDKHFTMRFAWNPIMLLEFMYKKMWGLNFTSVYRDAKAWKPINKLEAKLLSDSSKNVNELLELFQLIDDNNKSPFVVYVSDFNTFKS